MAEMLEGITIYEGEIVPIYSLTCPRCDYDRLEFTLFLNTYQCQRCGHEFKTCGIGDNEDYTLEL
jgi:uncharacterized protein (DUF983 family)